MHQRPTPSIGHMAATSAILREDRTSQVEGLVLDALRRFKPAGPASDDGVAAKALAVALTSETGAVPTAALVRRELLRTLGVDRSAGRVAGYLRGFMPGED